LKREGGYMANAFDYTKVSGVLNEVGQKTETCAKQIGLAITHKQKSPAASGPGLFASSGTGGSGIDALKKCQEVVNTVNSTCGNLKQQLAAVAGENLSQGTVLGG